MRGVSALPCPRCGAARLHRSRGLAGLRWLTSFVGVRRYRCRGCGAATWQRTTHATVASTPKRRRRLVILAGVVIAVGAFAGLSVIYLAGAP
jgi:hypothetical protein